MTSGEQDEDERDNNTFQSSLCPADPNGVVDNDNEGDGTTGGASMQTYSVLCLFVTTLLIC